MLNSPANSTKFCRNLHAPVDIYRANVYGFIPAQSMLLWIWERPNIASSSNNTQLVMLLKAICLCSPWFSVSGERKKDFNPNKKNSLGSWVFSTNTRNRYIRLTEWGSLTRPIQAELILYSRKNVIITSFQIFVVFPTEELKFLTFFEGTPWGRELNSEGGGEVRPCEVRVFGKRGEWKPCLAVETDGFVNFFISVRIK